MPTPRRIQVIGSAGAGKTTFARQLAQRLNIPHQELDAIYWQPGWGEPELATFRAELEALLSAEAWVVDGNYRRIARQVIWSRADTVVFLDFPFWLSFGRLLRRTWGRITGRTELWGGNRETLAGTLFSRDSILWYTVRTHRRKRRQNLDDFRDPAYAHLQVLVFGSPQEAEAWLAALPPG